MNMHCIIISTSHMQNTTTTKKRSVPQKKLFHLTSDKPKLIRNLLIFLMLHIFLFFPFSKKMQKRQRNQREKGVMKETKIIKKEKMQDSQEKKTGRWTTNFIFV